MVVDVAQLDHARHCSVQWRRVVAVSQHTFRPALHIVSIDSEFN